MDKCIKCQDELTDVKHSYVEIINMTTGLSSFTYMCDKCYNDKYKINFIFFVIFIVSVIIFFSANVSE